MKRWVDTTLTFIRSHPKIDVAFLLVALAIFVTITLFNADRASIWFDEAFSAYITQFSFFDIARYTATDVHPPLYYWVLKLWEMLFGSSIVALRSLSIALGAGAITVAFLFTRRQFGRLAAGVSLLFMVLSPMLIRYSDEARMYTLAALIIMLATYAFVKAHETNQRRHWIIYAVLVSLGMWTHYFTALIWITHLLWRAVMIRKTSTKPKLFWKKLFTRNVIITYIIAVALFIPWLPFMAIQMASIQGGAFWIGDIGAYSFPNFFTNLFYYLEHHQTTNWAAFLLVLVLGGLTVLSTRIYRKFNRQEKLKYLLVVMMAFVPAIILFVTSLPPLSSSFVERYLIPSAIMFTIFAAVTIVVGTRSWKPIYRVGSVLLIAGMMIWGITNVYSYGNYNKNSGTHILTRDLVEAIDEQALPGEPIVANSPYLFYEAVYYNSDEHPIYFIDEITDYQFGSTDMLKKNDQYKIKNLDAFSKENKTVWYIGVSDKDIEAPSDDWQATGKTIVMTSPVDGKKVYRATEYRLQ